MINMHKLIILILVSCTFLGCQAENKNNASKDKVVKIDKVYSLQLGVEGENKFIEYAKDSLDKQPAGISFRNLNFNPPNLGKVSLDVAGQSLIIDHVFNVMGSSIDYDPNLKGIQTLDINAGLNKEEFVNEEEAYQAYTHLVKQLNKNGWQKYILISSARIDNNDNLKSIYDTGLVVDPNYILSYEEWSNFFNINSSFDYNLYQKGVYLTISINKGKSKDNQKQYMLRYDVRIMKYYIKNLISESRNMNSIELKKAYDLEMLKFKNERLISEKDIIKQGYKIDENYKDPDVWDYVK